MEESIIEYSCIIDFQIVFNKLPYNFWYSQFLNCKISLFYSTWFVKPCLFLMLSSLFFLFFRMTHLISLDGRTCFSLLIAKICWRRAERRIALFWRGEFTYFKSHANVKLMSVGLNGIFALSALNEFRYLENMWIIE